MDIEFKIQHEIFGPGRIGTRDPGTCARGPDHISRATTMHDKYIHIFHVYISIFHIFLYIFVGVPLFRIHCVGIRLIVYISPAHELCEPEPPKECLLVEQRYMSSC